MGTHLGKSPAWNAAVAPLKKIEAELNNTRETKEANYLKQLEKYEQAAQVAAALERAAEMGKDGIDPEGDYEVDEKQRSCTLTDEGFAKAEQLLGVSDLYDPQDPWAHYITNALKAKELFIRDVN